jgi:hypothetical protein
MPSASIPAAIAASSAAAAGTTAAAGAATAAAASAGAAATVGGSSLLAGALPLAAAGISAFGQIQSANAAASAASYNSQMEAENAKLATQNAKFAGEEGDAQIGIQGQKTKAQLGGILANQGASGVSINSGSDVDVRSSAAALGELNALTIRSQATQRAYGYQTQAVSDTAQSKLDAYQSTSDEEGGAFKAGGTLLSTVANPQYNYMNWLNSNSSVSTG